MLLTAGSGTYKVNYEMVPPTKNRCILGGLPIHLISFGQQPPYKSPLFIGSLNYQNPFTKKD